MRAIISLIALSEISAVVDAYFLVSGILVEAAGAAQGDAGFVGVVPLCAAGLGFGPYFRARLSVALVSMSLAH